MIINAVSPDESRRHHSFGETAIVQQNGTERHERSCNICGLVKITIVSREWRRRDGVVVVSEPACHVPDSPMERRL